MLNCQRAPPAARVAEPGLVDTVFLDGQAVFQGYNQRTGHPSEGWTDLVHSETIVISFKGDLPIKIDFILALRLEESETHVPVSGNPPGNHVSLLKVEGKGLSLAGIDVCRF